MKFTLKYFNSLVGTNQSLPVDENNLETVKFTL